MASKSAAKSKSRPAKSKTEEQEGWIDWTVQDSLERAEGLCAFLFGTDGGILVDQHEYFGIEYDQVDSAKKCAHVTFQVHGGIKAATGSQACHEIVRLLHDTACRLESAVKASDEEDD